MAVRMYNRVRKNRDELVKASKSTVDSFVKNSEKLLLDEYEHGRT